MTSIGSKKTSHQTIQPDTSQPPAQQSGGTAGTDAAAGASEVAAVSNDRDIGVNESGGPGGVRGRVHDLAERGVGKLKEMTWDEIRASHDLGTTLGSSEAGLGIRVYEEILEDKQLSPLQKQTVERMEAELRAQNPERELKVRFVTTRGVMKPQVGLSKGGFGGVGAAVGFDASSPVEYRATRPYVFEGDSLSKLFNDTNKEAIKAVLKDNTLALPHDSADLRAMEPGSEIELIGKGTFSVSASVGAGVGESGELGPVEWNAGASASAGVTRTGSATLSNRIKVLDDDKIHMKTAVVDDKARSVWLRANAGVTVEVDGLLEDVPGLGSSGTLAEALRGAGADAIEDTVRDLTAFHASASSSKGEQKTGVNAFVIDLDNPEAARLFDDTNRLKTKAFSAAGARQGSGVTETRYTEELDSQGRQAEVKFAGKRLFLYRALKQEKEGRLETPDGSVALIRTGRYERERNILGWKRNIEGEGVHISRTDAEGKTTADDFFHGTYSQRDRVPRDKEVNRLRNFVGGLGIEGGDKLEASGRGFLGRLFSSGDNLEIKVDAYIARDGLSQIADADTATIRSAYADAVATLDPSLEGVPVNKAQAAQLARRFAELDDQVGTAGDDSHDIEWQMRDLGQEYAQLIGSDKRGWRAEKLLRRHVPVFEGADKTATMIQDAVAKRADGEWTQLVPDIMEHADYRYDSGLLTLASLAGRDNVLVHGLDISSKNGDISLSSEDEGALQHPDEMVEDAVNQP